MGKRGTSMPYRSAIVIALLLMLPPLCGSSALGDESKEMKPGSTPMKPMEFERLELTSPVFENGKTIPILFTCDGVDASPPLNWDRVPEGTRSFALFCDDPDAPHGNWVHWVIFNIPPDSTSLPQGLPRVEILPDSTRQGLTDFKVPGYGGPCPPSGIHRYFFLLYALDTVLEFEKTPHKPDVEKAAQGHVIGKGLLMGTYTRE